MRWIDCYIIISLLVRRWIDAQRVSMIFLWLFLESLFVFECKFWNTVFVLNKNESYMVVWRHELFMIFKVLIFYLVIKKDYDNNKGSVFLILTINFLKVYIWNIILNVVVLIFYFKIDMIQFVVGCSLSYFILILIFLFN